MNLRFASIASIASIANIASIASFTSIASIASIVSIASITSIASISKRCWSEWETLGPIDRTPGIPGSDKKQSEKDAPPSFVDFFFRDWGF